MRKVLMLSVAATLVLGAAGCGDHDSHGGSSEKASRTVEITMKEFSFTPAEVPVQAGETVKFVFKNEGQILHDAFIGDDAAQAEHEKEMRDNSGRSSHHGHDAIKVLPGKTGEITYTFDKAGMLLIGCHETGHYGAGMKMALTVS